MIKNEEQIIYLIEKIGQMPHKNPSIKNQISHNQCSRNLSKSLNHYI